jgi:hypothetical protein
VVWRVPVGHVVAKAATAVALAVLAVFLDAQGALLAWAGAAVGAGLTARDLVFPVRLAADDEGLTVRRKRLAWSQIVSIRVDVRQRLGLTARMLEIDDGDRLYLLSVYDLGAQPDDVAAELNARLPAGGG